MMKDRMRPPWERGRHLVPVASLVFIAILILPVPLVLAVPVDPTWIPGLYDDGDYDEVVDTLLSAEAVPILPSSVACPITAGRPVAMAVDRGSITASFDVVTVRGPPSTLFWLRVRLASSRSRLSSPPFTPPPRPSISLPDVSRCFLVPRSRPGTVARLHQPHNWT